MKDFFELREKKQEVPAEAYRKPTPAEIAADKAKERKASGSKGPDSSARYKSMKKKMYGNAMGGLKKEESELKEALVKVTDVEFNYREQLPNSPKPSDLGAISGEWKQDRMALRDAVKKMGGLVTNTISPSRGNKWVGTVTIGTREDPSKLDDKSIQKAVKSHGIEIHADQFRESTSNFRQSIDRIQAKKTRDSLSPSEKDKLAKLHALMKKQRKTGNYKMESTDLEEKYAVKYTHPTDKKSGRTTGPMSKSAADKKAKMGNSVDKVGGKYTVIRHVESVEESTMADRQVAKAMRIAKDMAGNHTGATKAIEKLKKGLSKHPKVSSALQTHNESVRSADKKPQNFRDPETGKMKVRMVPVDRNVIKTNEVKESVELDEKNLRKMDHDEFMKSGDSNPKGRADPAWNAERKRRYKNAQSKNYRKMKNEEVELDEATAKIMSTMSDKVASGAQRFGLKATVQGVHVNISGSKGKLNDYLRAIIGRSSYGNASVVIESAELEENKIFFVKVGDGRDSMTVKTKAANKNDALKKVRAENPKDKVSLDQNQKQGQPAGTFESVELSEAPDLMKMSKELLKHKDKGIDYEKAAAYVRTMHNNSSLMVQDKAMKGLLSLLKNMDLTDRTTITKILKDNGFKVKGGQLMREELEESTETLSENYRQLAVKGMGAETKNSINVGRDVDYYDGAGTKRMGKITKMTKSGYIVRDEKDGKNRAYTYYDSKKAKELLAK